MEQKGKTGETRQGGNRMQGMRKKKKSSKREEKVDWEQKNCKRKKGIIRERDKMWNRIIKEEKGIDMNEG